MKLLTSITALTIAIMNSSQAYALSCSSNGFDLETHFKTNKKSSKNITYVIGKFSDDAKKEAKPDFQGTTNNGVIRLIPQRGKTTKTTVNFSGKRMTKAGEKAFKTKVTIQTSCISAWCGNLPKSSQYTIAALEKTSAGYVLNISPCNPNTFSRGLDNDWAKLKRLIR